MVQTAMSAKPVVLIIEGASSDGESLTRLLHSHQYHTIITDSPVDAMAYLESPVDLVLSGFSPSHPQGRDLLQTWRARRPETPFAVMTDERGVAAAESAVAMGAVGYVQLPLRGDQTLAQVAKWLEYKRPRDNGQPVGESHNGRQHSSASANESDQLSAIKIPPGTTLEALERAAVEQALVQHRGNRTHAAKELGISVRTLQRKLKAWGGGNPSRAAPPSPSRIPGTQAWDTSQSSARPSSYRPRLVNS